VKVSQTPRKPRNAPQTPKSAPKGPKGKKFQAKPKNPKRHDFVFLALSFSPPGLWLSDPSEVSEVLGIFGKKSEMTNLLSFKKYIN
jgi:hypothetical protein